MQNQFHPDAILHSDQVFHYTHPLFQKRVKKLNKTQSMSRKVSCWDNSPMESFFGHFKDEVDYKECNSFIELKQMVDSYIDEYNNHHSQWGLKQMTPVQYRFIEFFGMFSAIIVPFNPYPVPIFRKNTVFQLIKVEKNKYFAWELANCFS